MVLSNWRRPCLSTGTDIYTAAPCRGYRVHAEIISHCRLRAGMHFGATDLHFGALFAGWYAWDACSAKQLGYTAYTRRRASRTAQRLRDEMRRREMVANVFGARSSYRV